MTPMFHDGENNRLCAHAARAEPVPQSSSSVAVPCTPPEDFALYRRAFAGALPVPADARCVTSVQRPRTQASGADVRLVIFSNRCAPPVKGFLTAPSR